MNVRQGPRLAFVTGGASGFGLAIARRLADDGAKVGIGDCSEDQLSSAVADDPRLIPFVVDVAIASSVTASIDACQDALGGLDTLVLSAGVVHIKRLETVTEDDWDLTLDVNLKGAFLASQSAAPALCASGRGRIIGIASDAARYGYAWEQAYCASKFGLVGLCQSLAAELAPSNVTVNCICPSACPTTGMGQDLTRWKAREGGRPVAAVLSDIETHSPLGRAVREEDVAAAVAYLVSDGANFVTGAILPIDGGSHFPKLTGV